MLEIILYTNRKGYDMLGDKWKPIDPGEFRDLAGLLLLAGAYKYNLESTII